MLHYYHSCRRRKFASFSWEQTFNLQLRTLLTLWVTSKSMRKLIGRCFLFHLTLYFHRIVKQFVQWQLWGFNKVQILTNKMLELEPVLFRNVHMCIEKIVQSIFSVFNTHLLQKFCLFVCDDIAFPILLRGALTNFYHIRHHVNLWFIKN